MPSIKEVASRISSVTATQQITQAMKMVAAARFSKMQQQVLQIRPYTEQLTAILENVLVNTKKQFAQEGYLAKHPVKNLLLVVMSSDRGLCGAFNTKVLRKALSYIQSSAYSQDPAQIIILPIGSKAFSFFKQRKTRIIKQHISLSHHLTFEHTSSVVDFLTKAFLQRTYDQVVLVYNAFRSAATYTPVVEQLLPVNIDTDDTPRRAPQVDYIYEPSNKIALIEKLVPQVLKTQFYKAQLESNAAEHGARMTTMSKATENAEELLKELKLTYNRTRQAAITQEISEIVAGANELAI